MYQRTSPAAIHPRPKVPSTSSQYRPRALARAPVALRRVPRFTEANRGQSVPGWRLTLALLAFTTTARGVADFSARKVTPAVQR